MAGKNLSRNQPHPVVAVMFFITSLVIFAIVSYTVTSAAQQPPANRGSAAALHANSASVNQSVHQLAIQTGQLSDQIGVSNNRSYQLHLYGFLLQNSSVLGQLVNTSVNCGPGTSGLNFSDVIGGTLSRPRAPNVPPPPPPINQTIHNLTINISQTVKQLGVAQNASARQALYVRYLALVRELGAYLNAPNTCTIVPKSSHYVAFVGYYLPGCSPSSPSPSFGVDSLPANEVSTLSANPPAGCGVWSWMVANTTNASRALSGATGPSFTQDIFSLLFSGSGGGSGGGGGGGNPYAVFKCLELQPYAAFFHTQGTCPLTEQINMTSNKTVAVIYAKTNPTFTWARSSLSNSSCTASPSPAFGSYPVSILTNGTNGPGLANITGYSIVNSNAGNSTNYYANAGPGCFVANASVTATSPVGYYGSSTSTSCTGASCQVAFNPGQYNPGLYQGRGTKVVGPVGLLTFVSGVTVNYQRVPIQISQPYGVAVSPSGKVAYVADSNTSGYSISHISVINTTSNTDVGSIYAGIGVRNVVFSPSGATAYVLATDGSINVVNVSTGVVTAQIKFNRFSSGNSYLSGLAISPSGSLLYVSDQYDNAVAVISTATDSVVTYIPESSGSGAAGVAFSPSGKVAYISSWVSYNGSGGSVLVVNTSTSSIVGTIGVDYQPTSVAFSPSGAFAYVLTGTGPSTWNEVSVINTSTSSVVNKISMRVISSGISGQVAFSPSGKVAYVTNNFGSCSGGGCPPTLSVINVTQGRVTGTIFTNGNSTMLYGATGVAFSTDGSTAYIANGDNTISVINVATGSVVSTIR